ncbi:MAG: riboflavin synthase [Proteobacteria bacterium]|jgi:riboflavin synthase|nr:riboflavin synthase [Pseudomonadota bacterium]
MFTGIIQAQGQCQAIEKTEGGSVFSIATPDGFLDQSVVGDSICVLGTCLTATSITANSFTADASLETLACTTLGDRVVGDALNLERALTPTTALGGHMVSGHVDGVATVTELREEGDAWFLQCQVTTELARYIARKGSICIDGVSLTVNAVDAILFSVAIIPHTYKNTTIHSYRVGSRVNIEVDVIARYVERLNTFSDS